MKLRFGSVCSGIEAASVAWNPLGWEAAWLSEIEPFPCALLAHHYPNVPNLGDMTTLPARILSGEVEAPDILCGGTPCQAFSTAGLRKSLDDDRGNLSLVFCEIANAIDTVRSIRGLPPVIIFWENVPGVLSTKDNAFGCFLAGLAGGDSAYTVPEGKWGGAGIVQQGERQVAWRTLDAQYFGVPQRRRRVFVIASSREGFSPSKILFESEGVSGDSEAGEQEGKETSSAFGEGSSSKVGLYALGGGGGKTRTVVSKWAKQCGSRAGEGECSNMVLVNTPPQPAPTRNSDETLCLMDQGGEVMRVTYDKTGTLIASTYKPSPVVLNEKTGTLCAADLLRGNTSNQSIGAGLLIPCK